VSAVVSSAKSTSGPLVFPWSPLTPCSPSSRTPCAPQTHMEIDSPVTVHSSSNHGGESPFWIHSSTAGLSGSAVSAYCTSLRVLPSGVALNNLAGKQSTSSSARTSAVAGSVVASRSRSGSRNRKGGSKRRSRSRSKTRGLSRSRSRSRSRSVERRRRGSNVDTYYAERAESMLVSKAASFLSSRT
jgi:hypothetical protein